jgi:ABC-2 type transport system permease protein
VSGRVQAWPRSLRLLWHTLVYEFRKAAAFRTGFIVREVLRGLPQPVVMMFVYHAMFRVDGLESLGGFTYPDMLHYLILVATFDKLLFHQRGLDLSDQIFNGYVTKFLVMPFRYFTLALGRWVQFLAVQLTVSAGIWVLGALLLPEWWPLPVSAAAAGQALVLIVLGSYCFFLTYFIINSLAFWLDVVWTLLVMVSFVGFFMRGTYVPVSVMPQVLQDVFVWLFPYWSLSAPLEIYLGRLGTSDFVRGLLVLAGTIVALELVRRELWRRGTRRYTGSGM